MPSSSALPRRPVLRWYGGKFMLRRWIVAHLPPHRIYVEPYGGAASVLLAKPRSFAEVYNDLDRSVVRLFRVLRDDDQRDRLIRLLHLTPFSREEFLESLAVDVELLPDPVEAARLFIVRSFQGRGADSASGRWRTGFRGNSWGSNRSAPADWTNYPESLRAVGERLRGVQIENLDALVLLRTHDKPDTLHYVDPPYLHETRSRARGYRHELDEEAHRSLAAALHELRGAVVLSGYDSPLYHDLYGDWSRTTRPSRNDGGAERTEVLWSNRPFAVEARSLPLPLQA